MSLVHALVPVKRLSEAKSRLAPQFDAQTRRNLMETAARHVLSILATSAVASVTVLTSDEMVADFARNQGAEIMAELPGESLNIALDRAAAALAASGRELILVLPADLPLLDHASLQALVDASSSSRAIMVASLHDGGTNALLCPPASFPYAFGANSAARHEARAAQAGLKVVKLELNRIALDLDTPEDFQLLCMAGHQ